MRHRIVNQVLTRLAATLLIVFLAVPMAANAVPITYQYVGPAFPPPGPYVPAGVTGIRATFTVDLDAYLHQQSHVPIINWSISDGLTTIDSSNADYKVTTSTFSTDASAQVIAAFIYIRWSEDSAEHPISPGTPYFRYFDTGEGAEMSVSSYCYAVNTNGICTQPEGVGSFAPGTLSVAPSDSDGDGIPNDSDLCPATGANVPVDANGCSDPQVDGDSDGYCDVNAASGGPSACVGADNCPLIPNADQLDTNADGYGDACVDPTVTIPAGSNIDPTVQIGAYTSIGKGVSVGADSEIGSSTTLSQNVTVGSDVTVGDSTTLSKGSSVGDGSEVGSNVIIGQSVYIGQNVTISDATTIGQGAVICSGANIGSSVIIGKYILIQTNVVVPSGSSLKAQKTAQSPSSCNAP